MAYMKSALNYGPETYTLQSSRRGRFSSLCFLLHLVHGGKWPPGPTFGLAWPLFKEGMFMQIKIEKAREGIFMVEGSRTTYLVEE